MKIKYVFILFMLFLLFSFVLFQGYWTTIPPKILMMRAGMLAGGVLVSSILALGGYVLQILLSNPLVEPYLIGVSGAASFGSTIAVFLGISPIFFYRSFFSILAGILITIVVVVLSFRKKSFLVHTAILLGISFNALFSSLIILLQSFLMPNDFYSSIRWLMGGIDYLSWQEILFLLIGFLLIFGYVSFFRRELYIFQTGEEMALSVGVETNTLKLAGFIVVALSTSISVSLSGMVAFLGLVVPHIARMLFPKMKERLFYPVLLTSWIIMSFALLLSRSLIKGTVVPVGVITSLIGAPFFIYLLFSKARLSENY